RPARRVINPRPPEFPTWVKPNRGADCHRSKDIIPTARWARRGGSQARTTAPDLRSGLAGVRGFKSLARCARRKVPSPAPHTIAHVFSENLYVSGPARAARGSEPCIGP